MKVSPCRNGAGILISTFRIFTTILSRRRAGKSWDDVPEEIKETFDRLGFLKQKGNSWCVKAQFESEVVYGSVAEDLEKQGVIFTDTDTALKEHPELLREYFGTIIPSEDSQFSALNSAVWSGGSFIYVPPGDFLCRRTSVLMLKTWDSSSGL